MNRTIQSRHHNVPGRWSIIILLFGSRSFKRLAAVVRVLPEINYWKEADLMKQLNHTQRGFATPAMFIAVIIAFVASLGIKTDEGITVAQSISDGANQPQTEFAATEIEKEKNKETEKE